MQTERETLELSLTTNFPNSEVAEEVLAPVVGHFVAAWRRYILAMWCHVNTVFRPKPGENSYRGHRYFRPVIPT
jgi:hypothetical protein